MPTLFNRLVSVCLCIAVTACGQLPRGAAVQSEVLAVAEGETADFAVFAVTRDMLPNFRQWPNTGGVRSYGWVGRQAGPTGRTILAGDTVEITIWDSADNSLLLPDGQRSTTLQPSIVSPNGNIFVPYVGSIRVSGMTADAARAKIETELQFISQSAQVQLNATAGRRHAFDLVSGVNSPGSFPLEERDMTILTALSLGGGALGTFDNPQIRLLRGDHTYEISLNKLFRSPTLNTTLRAGDKILVKEDDRHFLALGASGTEEIITFPTDGVMAQDALALMGGIDDARANPQGVLILREYRNQDVRSNVTDGPSHTRVVFTLDLTTADGLFSAGNFLIHPHDLVLATESPVNSATTVLGILGSVLSIAK